MSSLVTEARISLGWLYDITQLLSLPRMDIVNKKMIRPLALQSGKKVERNGMEEEREWEEMWKIEL